MNDMDPNTKPTFRRYEEGADVDDWDLQEKIFQADTSHKCPTYIHKTPPCQGSCPSGHNIRGWLAIARGMDKAPDPEMPWQEYGFPQHGRGEPLPRHHGPRLPRALRGRV